MKFNIENSRQVHLSVGLIDSLNRCLIEELNIYNHAFLQLDRPLIKSSFIHPKTRYEILLDSYNKHINEKEKDFFNSLYTESMNILLGKIFTNLENNFNLSATISSPHAYNEKEMSSLLESHFKTELFSVGYKLISNGQEFDCRLIFNINKNKLFEA